MASNEIPRTYTPLTVLAADAADGATTHGTALGIKQNTAATIRADRATAIAAEETAAVKRTNKGIAISAHQTADSNGKAFIARFILAERPRLGNDWSLLWQEAGFTGGSIAIPDNMGDRYTVVGEIKGFLHNHPTYAVTDATRPELDVTEAIATTLYDAITTARSAVNAKTNESSAATAARLTALENLRRRLGGLRDELLQLPLPADSPLWYAFGFNRPADPATPGIPEHLVLAAGAAGTGMLIVDWTPARRATGYRVKIQVAGEAEPRVQPLEPVDQAFIPGLPTGVLLTVTVAAHNAAGDGAECAPATITLH